MLLYYLWHLRSPFGNSREERCTNTWRILIRCHGYPVRRNTHKRHDRANECSDINDAFHLVFKCESHGQGQEHRSIEYLLLLIKGGSIKRRPCGCQTFLILKNQHVWSGRAAFLFQVFHWITWITPLFSLLLLLLLLETEGTPQILKNMS